ncbi:FAD-dependent oxidoreductase [Lapillicoccus sp.]|uniref:FAD-dependent oxidoreductase n=1 Tax=Lapillicoccus sp. TaxID=1909287 RepID=UPI003265FFC6
MKVAVIGAGPVGLVLAAALARRGSDVTLVDRDPGPPEGGTWARKGVMQFHHAHAVRPQAVRTVRREVPGVDSRLADAGAESLSFNLPDGTEVEAGLGCRRSTFEQVLRAAVLAVPRVTYLAAHVDAVTERESAGHSRAGVRASGVVADGQIVDADLVVDASGRSGRVNRQRRAPQGAGGACGIAYVDRQYQLLPGAEPGPLVNPLAWQANLEGYQCIVFPHELGIFSVLIVRPSDGRDLVGLRHEPAFVAACRAIPGLAEWTDPLRSVPVTGVLPGGSLINAFRSQRSATGELALPGLVFVGDSVCTTTPNFGRGLATSMMQVDALLRFVDEALDPAGTPTADQLTGVGEEFDAWCEAHMRPWVEDHDLMDSSLRRRWAGEDLDLSSRIPSDLVMAAAEVDPRITPVLGPYVMMTALPSSLDPVQPLARAVYETGWRPAYAPGPTRTELAAVVAAALV